jgi:ChrR Cupin-like domain
MELNADFSKRAAVHAGALPWVASPMAGVERRMLDRIGDEVARATSVVRYAPASRFSPHTHGGGEEFLVLEGVFSDEHGDFPAGTYVRNPPTSRHTPGSTPGCVIFVKLWQFDPGDRTHVRLDTTKSAALPDPSRSGVAVTPLYRDAREDVRIETWAPRRTGQFGSPGGAELFVLDGTFEESSESFTRWSWLRLPHNVFAHLRAGEHGFRAWVKTGHLRKL